MASVQIFNLSRLTHLSVYLDFARRIPIISDLRPSGRKPVFPHLRKVKFYAFRECFDGPDLQKSPLDDILEVDASFANQTAHPSLELVCVQLHEGTTLKSWILVFASFPLVIKRGIFCLLDGDNWYATVLFLAYVLIKQ